MQGTRNDLFSGSSKNFGSSPCHVSYQDDFPYPHLWHLLQYHAHVSLLSLKRHKTLLELCRRQNANWIKWLKSKYIRKILADSPKFFASMKLLTNCFSISLLWSKSMSLVSSGRLRAVSSSLLPPLLPISSWVCSSPVSWPPGVWPALSPVCRLQSSPDPEPEAIWLVLDSCPLSLVTPPFNLHSCGLSAEPCYGTFWNNYLY